MQLIWSQVVTHIIGFLIAVFILRKYAWGPLLRMLEERRQKIEGEFKAIDEGKREAGALKAEYEGQLRTIEVQARARIQEGAQEGQRLKTEIEAEGRDEARELLARARDEIERERDKAHVTLRNDMVEMVIGATEKLLRERLDDQKHRQLITEFIASLDQVHPRGGEAR